MTCTAAAAVVVVVINTKRFRSRRRVIPRGSLALVLVVVVTAAAAAAVGDSMCACARAVHEIPRARACLPGPPVLVIIRGRRDHNPIAPVTRPAGARADARGMGTPVGPGKTFCRRSQPRSCARAFPSSPPAVHGTLYPTLRGRSSGKLERAAGGVP